jgi:hypothetical protein
VNSEKRLSIVVPIHKSSEKSSNSPLKRWTNEIDNRCNLILSLDHIEEENSLTEWCQKEMPSNTVIVHGKFGNPGQTRNNALNEVSCEWLAFVDSDDYFDYSSALDSINSFDNSYDLIVCNYLSISEDTGKTFEGKNPKCLSDLFPELGFWRILYRTQFVQGLQFPSYRMGEDQVFFSRVLSRGPKIGFSPHIIYNYFSGSAHQISKTELSVNELGKSLEQMRIELPQSAWNLNFRKLVLLRQEVSYAIRVRKKVLLIVKFIQLNLGPSGILLSLRCFTNLFLWYLSRKFA